MSARQSCSRRIDELCTGQHSFSNPRLQAIAGHQVHRALQELGKLLLHPTQSKEAHPRPRLELDQDVDVTARAEIVPQCGAKDGETTDAMALTEASDSICRKLDPDFGQVVTFPLLYWLIIADALENGKRSSVVGIVQNHRGTLGIGAVLLLPGSPEATTVKLTICSYLC